MSASPTDPKKVEKINFQFCQFFRAVRSVFFCSADHGPLTTDHEVINMVTRVDHVSGGQWSVVTRVDHVSGGQWSEVSFALKSTMDRPRGALTPDCTAVLN